MARRILGAMLGCAGFLAPGGPAWGDAGTASGLGNPASASLKFAINIDKFVYLRIGNAGTNISTVSFAPKASIPSAPTTPGDGNRTPVNWNGGAPTFSAPTGVALPVEVRSNGGTVSLKATTTTALTSGSSTIPMTHIAIATDDNALPAPPLAASGTGGSVNVTGTAFGNLVTSRTANWTFTYTPVTTPMAGTYSGVVTFTATTL